MADTHHEHIVPNLRNNVRFYYSDEPLPKYVPFHWHNSIELVLVLDGLVRFTLDGRQVTARDDEFVAVPSGAVHDVTSGPNHAYVLQVPLREIHRYYEHPESAGFENGQRWTSAYQQVVDEVKVLGRIASRPSDGASFDFEIHLLQVLKLLFTELRAPKGPSGTPDRVKEILAYLQAHATEKITVGALAERFAYNPSYLSRMFKEQTGIGVVDYLYELRANRLMDDLLTSDAPVAELMKKNGLANERLARETFRRLFGMLPKDVRKKAHALATTSMSQNPTGNDSSTRGNESKPDG